MATPITNTPTTSSVCSLQRVPAPVLTEDEDEDSDLIPRPPHVGVSHVMSIFALIYPGLDEQGRAKEYKRFRDHLDRLAVIHLDSSLVLMSQDKDDMAALFNDMSKEFVWLEHCPNNWPVSVCLQVKLHNSARSATNKSNKKVIAMINGNRPPKTSHRKSSTPTAGPSRSA
ncbi:hypothetical protein MSAN_01364700 [Mycena sanguinolenta]|uniref:Uncharacterized protein n=1 Tax=Mycena sanguinolenta TaxID=230812 RepID=A0A8H6Y8T4_9AGAR|nr:hypothetical protein MSAN_01364700 [Mycena sanguinolenta]